MVDRITRRSPFPALAAATLLAATAGSAAQEQILLRKPGGAFLGVDASGSICLRGLSPQTAGVFHVVRRRQDAVLVRPVGWAKESPPAAAPAASGKRTVPPDRPNRQPAALPGGGKSTTRPVPKPGPNDGPLFEVVRQAGGGAALRSVRQKPTSQPKPTGGHQEQQAPSESTQSNQQVEVYRYWPYPPPVCSALSLVLTTVTAQQLEGRVYEDQRQRHKEKYVRLPAPTLKDPKRTKKHRILSMTEQYRVRAELDGAPVITVRQLLCLQDYFHGDHTQLLFVLEGHFPVHGEVNYRIPRRASLTTRYKTTATVQVVGQVSLREAQQTGSLGAPELLDVRLAISGLDISNDLLNIFRAPLEDLINRQIRRNHQQVRREANRAIRKAFEQAAARQPILQYLQSSADKSEG